MTSMTRLDKADQERQLQRLAQSLPDNLPTPNTALVDLASNTKKLRQFRSRGESVTDLNEKAKLKETEKKYSCLLLTSHKQALTDVDKHHTKAIIELKLLLQKIERLQKFKSLHSTNKP